MFPGCTETTGMKWVKKKKENKRKTIFYKLLLLSRILVLNNPAALIYRLVTVLMIFPSLANYPKNTSFGIVLKHLLH